MGWNRSLDNCMKAELVAVYVLSASLCLGEGKPTIDMKGETLGILKQSFHYDPTISAAITEVQADSLAGVVMMPKVIVRASRVTIVDQETLASHSVKTISHNCLEMKPRGAG
jgi:hypothetical protein